LTITTARRLVVSRTNAGGIAVREQSPDRSVPYGGRLVGYTVRGHDGWLACHRGDDGELWGTCAGATAEAVEILLRATLDMPLTPEEPCIWCGMDPETPFCCGGNHPARWALMAELANAPEITFGGA